MSQTKTIFPIKGNLLQQLSVILQILRLYLPNILLIAAFALAFLNLSQGADVLTKTSENTKWYPGIFVLLALFFWVYVVWYSGRIIAYLENGLFFAAPGMLFHLPRLLGFYIYALFVIAFLNTPALLGSLSPLALLSLLIIYGILYWQLNVWIRVLSVIFRKKYGTLKFSRICGIVFWLNPLVIITCGLIRESNFSMIIGASLLQFIFIFLVINRRNIKEVWPAQKPMEFMENMLEPIFEKAQGKIPRFEEYTFTVFNLVSLLALIIYCLAIFSLPFAITFGTLGVILLALGFYSGLYNMLKMFSMIYRIRLSFFLFILMLTGGFIFEPHNIEVLKTGPNHYDQRMNLRAYTYNWLQQHEEQLADDSIPLLPVILVHADGGASRSGYWTASVLGKLDSITQGKFGRNLFALSGASGGSVGNSTFFALLYLRNHKGAMADSIKKYGMIQPATDFLKTDFLTFTLARLLGPDCFNAIYPFTADRARALEYSMEYGAGNQVLLNGFFALPFSRFATRHNIPYTLPVLFINTTRMQDGLPGVISNIKPDPSVFGRRLDVLALLPVSEDIRLSTAVVLGARFPYLSPAGCITRVQYKENGAAVKERHYFVDGGYFDNSGAGVIHETIMEMNRLIHSDTLLRRRYGIQLHKLRFLVIHITNTPYAASSFKKALPFNNDLAAPLLTLAGSYTSQTSVNNSRLENYMRTLYYRDPLLAKAGLRRSYYEVNLYSNNRETYTMNWSISDATLKRMQSRLNNNIELDSLINELNRLLP